MSNAPFYSKYELLNVEMDRSSFLRYMLSINFVFILYLRSILVVYPSMSMDFFKVMKTTTNKHVATCKIH